MLTEFARDQLEAAIAHSNGDRLVACPPAEPLPGQVRTYYDAVARARAAGLRLPRRLSVHWVDVPRGSYITDGTTWHLGAGVVRIWLNANLWPDRLREVVYHELKHAEQAAIGFEAFSARRPRSNSRVR